MTVSPTIEPRNLGGRLVRRKLSFETHFTQIPNAYVRDARLSYKARGILVLLMSHDAGQEVSLKKLAQGGTDSLEQSKQEGLSAVRSAVEELEYHGYLKRESTRNGEGTYGTTWELTEPVAPLFTAVDNSAFENRTRPATAFENRTNTAFENRTHKEHHLRTLTKTSQSNPGTHARSAENAASGAPQTGYALAAGERCSAKPERYRDRGHHYEQPSGYCTFCSEHESTHANPSTGEIA